MENVIAPEKMLSANFKAYEDGKHRRYTLLFSVNGGAFAVAKIAVDKDSTSILGHLTIGDLSIGMILFSIVMTYDIFQFGIKMKKNYLPHDFGTPGKVVLILIGLLFCTGWLFVAI
jgi:hypothetical protein